MTEYFFALAGVQTRNGSDVDVIDIWGVSISRPLGYSAITQI